MDQDNAVIVIVNADMTHGELTPAKDGKSVKEAYFSPPKAIYMDVREGGSTAGEGGTYSFALLDDNYSFTLNNDGIFFILVLKRKPATAPTGVGGGLITVPMKAVVFRKKR